MILIALKMKFYMKYFRVFPYPFVSGTPNVTLKTIYWDEAKVLH